MTLMTTEFTRENNYESQSKRFLKNTARAANETVALIG